MAEQGDAVPNPNDDPGILDPVIPDPAKWETPPNPALKFLYDPANANLIALLGWGAIISFLYIYVYGTPKLFSKKSRNKNYQQQESSSAQQSREERLKKLQDELDKTAADRIKAKKEKEEEERRKKAEMLREKHEAMQQGGTYQGNSYSLADDEEARQKALEEAKKAKERREAAKKTRSHLRDDDFNPLGGSESAPRYRNTSRAARSGG